MIKELTDVLEIQLKHATVKHPQTVGTVERSHSSLKNTLKMFENYTSSNWPSLVEYACYAHNTSYHSTTQCTPSLLFHGRDPLTPLDLRYGPSNERIPVTRFQYTTEVKDRMAMANTKAKECSIAAYIKYRACFDRQAKAQPLQLHQYCLLLNPKLTKQDAMLGKGKTKWIALFRVEKVLTDMNYIVRKVGSWFTQCVHRIRLRPFKPTYAVDDLPAINESKFVPDPYNLPIASEPEMFDEQVKELVNDGKPPMTDEEFNTTAFNYTPIISESVRMRLGMTNHPPIPTRPVATTAASNPTITSQQERLSQNSTAGVAIELPGAPELPKYRQRPRRQTTVPAVRPKQIRRKSPFQPPATEKRQTTPPTNNQESVEQVIILDQTQDVQQGIPSPTLPIITENEVTVTNHVQVPTQVPEITIQPPTDSDGQKSLGEAQAAEEAAVDPPMTNHVQVPTQVPEITSSTAN